MRLVKATLAGLLVLGLGVMWSNRSWVSDAYRSSDDPGVTVRLSGVDLDVAATELAPTPYTLPTGPDTRAEVAPAVLGIDAAPPAGELTPPSLAGGDAELNGTVTGPDGPVAGAVVRVERHTDRGVASMDAITGDDGAWAIAPVAGGRYRVRAWLPGLLTMGRSDVRFVADDETATFDVEVWGIDPSPVLEFVDGGPLYEGGTGSVAVVAGWRSIDLEGLVVTNPMVGAAVTVTASPQVEILNQGTLVTDASGTAWVQLRCLVVTGSLAGASASSTVGGAVGPIPGAVTAVPTQAPTATGPAGSLTARTGTTEATFELPGCQPVPPPEPEVEVDPETGEPVPAEPGAGPDPDTDGGGDDG